MEYLIVVLTKAFLQIFAISIGCVFVLVPLLLSVPIVQKKVSARSFYILYLLLAVRLLVPLSAVLPQQLLLLEPLSVLNDVKTELSAADPKEESLNGTYLHADAGIKNAEAETEDAVLSDNTGAAKQEVSVISILAFLWIAGTAACILWAVGSWLAARHKLMAGCILAQKEDLALLKRLMNELKVKRAVGIYRSRRITSPVALGLFKPAVILPYADLPDGDLALILRHELIHIRRWDIAYKAVLFLSCAVHWFNPLVWMMSRQAGYNLEMCCDDEAIYGLSGQDRRRYGNALLNAAQSFGRETFSAGFANGKKQLKLRLTNLFVEKKHSSVFVCVVLAAAILMSGLIGFENVQGVRKVSTGKKVFVDKKSSADKKYRKLYEDYFYKHYKEEEASVILADLSGDGKAEMAVLTMNVMQDDSVEWQAGSMRKKIRTEDFANANIDFYYVKDGKVVEFPGTAGVANAHAGWGYCYLVPYGQNGYALLDFKAYTDASGAYFSYGLSQLDLSGNMGEFITFEQGSAYAQAEAGFVGKTEDSAGNHESDPAELLERVARYRDSGVPFAVFQDVYMFMEGNVEFQYLNVDPSDAFSGKTGADVQSLSECVVTNGGKVKFLLPSAE